MIKSLAVTALALTSFLPTVDAAVARPTVHHHYYRSSHAKRKTVKRVGIGAAGGAVVGALAGGGTGAAIGAAAGGGAGALYDHHEKKLGK